MATDQTCPGCGLIDTLVTECIFSQQQVVCTGCGHCSQQITLTHESERSDENAEFTSSSSSTGSTLHHLASKVRCVDVSPVSKTKQAVRHRLLDVASHFGLNATMTAEAEQLFNDTPICRFGETTQVVLAACCVYVVSRRHGMAVALSYVANYVNTPRSRFVRALHRLLHKHDLQIEGVELKAMATSCLRELDLSSCDPMEISRMEEIIHGLIDAAKRTLVVEGVNAQPFLSAAAYIAWCCATFPPRKSNFSAFCRKTGALHNSTSGNRLNELIVLLIELANTLPWFDGQSSINKKTVFLHVNTILKYRKTLVADREMNFAEPDLLSTVIERRRRSSKRRQLTDHGGGKDGDVSVTASSATSPENDEELTEDDIPDEEIWNYLRTSAEIEYVTNLSKNRVKS